MVKLAWVDVVQWVLGQISINENAAGHFMVKLNTTLIMDSYNEVTDRYS